MPNKKQKLINETLKYLLSEIEKVEPNTAKLLRQKINGKKVPVYFKVLPKQKTIKTSTYKGTKMQTKGLTTTIYYPENNKPLAHIITLPEKEFFSKRNGRIAIKKNGIVTLLHELKHLSRANFQGPRIMEELEADLFTVKMLKQLQFEKERREYIESRPLFKKLLMKARERMARTVKAKILTAKKEKKLMEEKLKKMKQMKLYGERDAEVEYRRR